MSMQKGGRASAPGRATDPYSTRSRTGLGSPRPPLAAPPDPVNSTQTLVAIAYGIALVVVAVIAVIGAVTATAPGPEDTGKLAEREKTWLVIVIVILASLLLATIFFTPYGTADEGHRQTVTVNSFQFAFTLEPARVQQGKIKFSIASSDVNHGFGLYNSKDELVFQTQAIPDDATEEVHTLKPGVYHVLCLEFCGVGHDVMTGRLVVTE